MYDFAVVPYVPTVTEVSQAALYVAAAHPDTTVIVCGAII